jgi:hypothetical protein
VYDSDRNSRSAPNDTNRNSRVTPARPAMNARPITATITHPGLDAAFRLSIDAVRRALGDEALEREAHERGDDQDDADAGEERDRLLAAG